MSTQYPVCAGTELNADPDICGIGVPTLQKHRMTVGSDVDLLSCVGDTTDSAAFRKPVLLFHQCGVSHSQCNMFGSSYTTRKRGDLLVPPFLGAPYYVDDVACYPWSRS